MSGKKGSGVRRADWEGLGMLVDRLQENRFSGWVMGGDNRG